MSNFSGGRVRASVASSGRSLDASALQSDMARRFGLPGAAVKRVKYLSAVSSATGSSNCTARRTASRPAARQHCCPSCAEVVSIGDTTCTNCGIFFRSIREFEPTLAEMRGLLKPQHVPVVVLAAGDWVAIEAKLWERQEWSCPICMEGFSTDHEVLLSCSHMFHRNCLASFEKFRGTERTCPVCREPNYQKKITRVGSKCFQVRCVTRLKALWRGYRARLLYYEILRDYYRDGHGASSRRKIFYENELTQYSKRVSRDVDARGGQITSLLSSSDAILSEGRQLDELFAQMLAQRLGGQDYEAAEADPPPAPANEIDIADGDHFPAGIENEISIGGVDWRGIWVTAVKRGLGECAVCMCANDNRDEFIGDICSKRKLHRSKPIAVLSCSHVFHDRCIHSFELYNKSDIPLCPMCRTTYEKKVVKSWRRA